MKQVLIVVVASVIGLVSCAGGGLSYTGSPGGPAYLPYVESIGTVPALVHEGESYEVVVHLSSQLNPDLLRGGPAVDWNSTTGKWQWFGLNDMARSDVDPDKSIIAFNLWIIKPVSEGEVTDSFTLFSVSGAIAGTSSYKILTADSREWGGLESTCYGAPIPTVLPHEHAVYREFEITVLPAEDAGD